MTDDQLPRPRSALALAVPGVRRPRRSPAESAPRLDPADRPDPAQVHRDRKRAARTWRKGHYPR